MSLLALAYPVLGLVAPAIIIGGILYLRRKRDERETARRERFMAFLRKVWPWSQ